MIVARATRVHGQHLVHLLLVLGEVDGGAGVGQQVLDLGGGVGRVEPDGDAADGDGGQVEQHPLGAVLGLDRHPVTGVDPEGEQPVGGVEHEVPRRVPGDSRQIPKSFSRIATWCGVRRAQSRAREATVGTPAAAASM